MRLFEILRHALRAAGGPARARRGGRRPRRATATASPRWRPAPPVATCTMRRAWFVLATGRLCTRAAIALDSALGHARAGARPAAARGPRRGRAAVRAPLLRRAAAGAGRASPSTRTCAPRAPRTCVVAGAALPGAVPWREGSGEGIALASGYRAAQVVGAQVSPRAATDERSGVTDLFVVELLRGSLDHCVKCTICETACPVSNATPLFPGPKYAGPQSERYRVADEPTVGRVGRLLLGLRDLLAGVPAGRQDRRDQRPGAQQAQAPEGLSAARPDHHPTDVARPRRHPGGADRQLDAALQAARGYSAEKVLGVHRDAPAPKFAGRRFSRWARKRAAASRRAAGARKIVYFHGCGTEYYEPWEGEKVVADPRAQRLRGGGAQAGLLRPAAAVQRAVRRGAQGGAAPGAGAAPARHRRGHDHRRQRHQLHADAQARGARDPLAGGRPGPEVRVRAHLRHLRAAARAARPRRAARPTSPPSTKRSPTTPPASSRATGWASRRSTCSRWCPGSRSRR